METPLVEAITGFHTALSAFETALAKAPSLHAELFAEAQGWRDLLEHKLLPYAEASDCLIVAVAGGTNTGKSTVFNLLVGAEVSPVRMTAAATARPLLAASPMRAEQCRKGLLFPKFVVKPLSDPEDLIRHESPPETLYLYESGKLPDGLALLDTPDVDSIEKEHWRVAEWIRAAGDVVVAVVTGEKYKDERVVQFCREARASGRRVLPVMNKANPEQADHETARLQLEDFVREAGLEGADLHVLPLDYSLEHSFNRPIPSLGNGPDLYTRLTELDRTRVKEVVLKQTLKHFATNSEDFLEQGDALHASLAQVSEDWEQVARRAAEAYDPKPDARVGQLLHEQIATHRDVVTRLAGYATGVVSRGVTAVYGAAGRAVRRRVRLEREAAPSQQQVLEQRSYVLRQEVQRLLRRYWESARSMREPEALLVLKRLDEFDAAAAENAVVRDVIEKPISANVRQHVGDLVDEWWKSHPVQRHVLREIDSLLVLAPTAVAVPVSVYLGGVGAPEIIAVSGILGGALFEQIFLNHFGDYWLRLLEPWLEEQRQHFHQALEDHVLAPVLGDIRRGLAPFESESWENLRRWHAQCTAASTAS